MYAPMNQIQSPDDEDEEQDDVVQQSFFSYYNHNLGAQPQQDLTAKKCADDFACFNGVSTASNPFKISCERLIEEGLDLGPAKKRKAGEGGGRVVRATGRKDRHSKVRTARGPRDRRVRLSPTTAIQFYDVQDRLGYDRPSKAIDWLINEAKAAIDALQNQPPTNAAPEDHAAGFSPSQRDDGNANSDFVGEPPPAAAAYLDHDYQLGFCSAFNSLETNWEMARLQKMFTWNPVSDNSGNARGGGVEYSSCNSLAPAPAVSPISGHTNLIREPLQSSIVNYASINNDNFAGFNFTSELSNIAAASIATPKQDDNFKKLIFSMPSAHCQD